MSLSEIPLIPKEQPDNVTAALRARLGDEFADRKDAPRFSVEVPLRLCPLGAHSDHQGGIVTGFTIDRATRLVAMPSKKSAVSVFSQNFQQRLSVDLGQVGAKVTGEWGNYLRGAIVALRESDRVINTGFSGVVYGEMPIGGLSSSASVSLAYLTALAYLNDYQISSEELVKLVLRIENGYLGLNNGVLDQSVILFSKRGALTVIDCRDNSVRALKLGAAAVPWEVLVIYSGLSRQLTATPFNQRVSECHEAARMLLELGKLPVPLKPRLGDVPTEVYQRFNLDLPKPLHGRAKHFFSEAERVSDGTVAWAAGDIQRFGELVTKSGESSIVNFESGSPALISLYQILAENDGVYGARFCGGGFQGCCLALIDPRKRDRVIEKVHQRYTDRHPELAKSYSMHICELSESVKLERI